MYNKTRDRPSEYHDDREGSRHALCPCCGKRVTRCSETFADIRQYLDGAKFRREMLTPMQNLSQDICFYNDCADTAEVVDNLRILQALGKTSLIWVIAIRTGS